MVKKSFSAKWYDVGIEACVWAILLFVPLFFSTKFYLSFEIAKMVCFRVVLYFGLLFYAFKVFHEGRVVLPGVFKSKVFRVLLVGVPLVYLLGWFSSIMPNVSFWGSYFRQQGLFSYLHYFAFFWLVFAGMERRAVVRSVCVAGVALGLILVYGIAQKFGFLIGDWNIDTFLGRVFSSFGHPNYFGSYLVLVFFPVLFGGWACWKKRIWAGVVACDLLALMILVNLVLTKGRASVLGIVVGMVVALVLLGLRKRARKFFVAAVLPVLILALGVGTVNVFKDSEFVRGNIVTSRMVLEGENLRSIQTRLAMWPSVVDMVGKSPRGIWAGYGLDTFAQAYAPYMDKDLLLLENFGDIPDRAHNVVLQWFVDLGVMGAGMILFGILWMAMFVVRQVRKGDEKSGNPEDRFLVIAGASSLAGIFAAHQFGFSVTAHLVYIWFLIAMVLKLGSFGEIEVLSGGGRRCDWWGVLSFGVIVAFFVTTLFPNVYGLARGDNLFVEGYAGISVGNRSEALEKIVEADYVNPHQGYYSYILGNIYLDMRGEALETALYFASEADRFATGNDGVYHLLLGRIWAEYYYDEYDDYFVKALEEFEKARALMPLYPDVIFETGKFYFLTGNIEKAISAFESYLDLSPKTWKDFDELDEYRLFYKANPLFNEVFAYLADAYELIGESEKAEYYGGFL